MSSLGSKTRVSLPVGTKMGDTVSVYGKQIYFGHIIERTYVPPEKDTPAFWDTYHAVWASINDAMNIIGSNVYAVMKDDHGQIEVLHARVDV